MTPGSYPLNLYRGDSYAWRFSLWSDVDKTVPIDLSGAAAAAQIRKAPDGQVLLEMVCTIELPNTVLVEITADDWPDTFAATRGVWDLQLTYGDAVVQTPLAGPVAVTRDVTVVVP